MPQIVEQPIPLSLDTPYSWEGEAAVDAPAEEDISPEEETAPDAAPFAMPDRDVPDSDAVAEDASLLWETTGLGASVARAVHLIMDSPVEWNPPSPEPVTDSNATAQTSSAVIFGQAHSMDTQARVRAVEAMLDGIVRESQPLPDELLWALADTNDTVRNTAAQGIQNLPDNTLNQAAILRLQEYVLSVFASMDANLISQLDKALPYLRQRLAQPMMNTLQSSSEATVRRRAAAYSLGRMGVNDARELLVRGAWAEDPELAWSCAEGLYMLEGSITLRDWLAMLEHPQDGIRHMAVRAMGRIGGPEALRNLRAILLGELEVDYNMQAQALQAVVEYPRRDAIPLLIDVMEQTPGLRTAAGNYLRHITQQDIGDSPDDWRQWYQGG